MPKEWKEATVKRFKELFTKKKEEPDGSTPPDNNQARQEEDEDKEEGKFKQRLVKIIIGAINNISNESDRDEIIRWFVDARHILQTGGNKKEIIKGLYSHIDSKRTLQLLWSSVTTSLRNYKDSDIPLSIKVAIPVTAVGFAIVGGAGAGLGMFGGAIGLPVVIILFLGTAGLTSIIEAFVKNKNVRDPLTKAVLALAALETKRRLDKALADMLRRDMKTPSRAKIPEEEAPLRQALLEMDPTVFEQHVMSFFEADGLPCGVSPAGRDKGIDGWANHPEGLIVVQCKRYAEDKPVGRPVVQQMKGVMEEVDAFRGYLVTTSRFTEEAKDSAVLNPNIMMVDMDVLVSWHKLGRRNWERESKTNPCP